MAFPDIGSTILAIVLVLLLILIFIYINNHVLFPFSNNATRPNESFGEYMQRLYRTRYYLYCKLAQSIKNGGLAVCAECINSKCGRPNTLSTMAIKNLLFNNSREIGNAFIPFFANIFVQKHTDGPKTMIENTAYPKKWATPYAPYHLTMHGTFIPIDNVIYDKLPFIQQKISDVLQSEVNLVIQIIWAMIKNNVTFAETYALLAGNTKEYLKILYEYNINSESGKMLPFNPTQYLNAMNKFNMLLLQQLNNIVKQRNLYISAPGENYSDLEWPRVVPNQFKTKCMSDKLKQMLKISDIKFTDVDSEVNNVISDITKILNNNV